MLSGAQREIEQALVEAEAELRQVDERRDELVRKIDRLRTALTALQGSDDVTGSGQEGPRRHTGKYRKLFEYLVSQEDDTPITMTFSEIEEVIGMPLPPSSRKHLPHWYGYEGSAVARAIGDAGWKARHVNLESETVEFWPHQVD